jgi:hypothetical protein
MRKSLFAALAGTALVATPALAQDDDNFPSGPVTLVNLEQYDVVYLQLNQCRSRFKVSPEAVNHPMSIQPGQQDDQNVTLVHSLNQAMTNIKSEIDAATTSSPNDDNRLDTVSDTAWNDAQRNFRNNGLPKFSNMSDIKAHSFCESLGKRYEPHDMSPIEKP